MPRRLANHPELSTDRMTQLRGNMSFVVETIQVGNQKIQVGELITQILGDTSRSNINRIVRIEKKVAQALKTRKSIPEIYTILCNSKLPTTNLSIIASRIDSLIGLAGFQKHGI